MKNYKITVNGNVYNVSVEESDGSTETVQSAQPASAPVQQSSANTASAGAEIVKSPMPGTILDIKVHAGEQVSAGTVLCVLEAMKMENDIVAPKDGIVDAVLVNKGEAVEVNSALISIN